MQHTPTAKTSVPERKATTRSEHVRELIEEGIATGKFPPGMRLDEVELAQRFDVSRTPLREALFQLASAGIVEMQPRRGTVVAEVSPHRMVEMFEVMGELEAMCGRLAARRMLAGGARAASRGASRVRSGEASERSGRVLLRERAFPSPDLRGQPQRVPRTAGFCASPAPAALPAPAASGTRSHADFPARARRRGAGDLAGDAELTAQRLRDHVVVQGQRFADLIASLAELQNGSNPLAMPKPAGTSDAPSAETAVRRTVR
jgi:DNA-binding transcriptional regulator YhcF (GntR family)